MPEIVVNDVVIKYMKFVNKLINLGYLVFINSPHCWGGNGQSTYPIEERNDICIYMNDLLKRSCHERNIRCISLIDVAVNKLTRKNN